MPRTAKPICGIYLIKNSVNGKVYVGQSRNIRQRIDHHFAPSQGTRHRNPLYFAMAKYGRQAFEWSVLEELPDDLPVLTDREQYWMDLYQSLDRKFGYNLIPADLSRRGPMDLTPEQREARSLSLTAANSRRWSDPENRRRQSLVLSAIKGTPQNRAEQSARAKEYMSTPEMRQRASERSTRMFQDPAQRELRREMMKSRWASGGVRKIVRPVLQIDKKTGEVICRFGSVQEALNTLGKTNASSDISQACREPKRSAYGYRWRYADETLA